MPSFTADFFGAKNIGGVYGWVLLAWGAAAIPSPIVIARIRQATGHFDQSLLYIAISMLVALILPIIARKPTRATTAVPAVAASR